MTPVHWIVDSYLTDLNPMVSGFPTLAEAVAEAGHPLHMMRYDPKGVDDENNPDFGFGKCVITYGTHQFVRQIERFYARRRWFPVNYCDLARHSFSTISSHFSDLMLSDDYVILPFSEIVRRRPAAWGGTIFMKPNAVTKAFAGLVVTEAEFDHEVNCLRQIQRPDEDMLCVVARPKAFEGEYRFIIADRKVVTGCQYMWNGDLDIRIDVPEICEAMAWEVAGRTWQPDVAYVCDVAWVEDRTAARVIEMNTFSSSGLYACDTRKIVSAISNCARRQYLEIHPS